MVGRLAAAPAIRLPCKKVRRLGENMGCDMVKVLEYQIPFDERSGLQSANTRWSSLYPVS
jgi:hypothetical protein